MPRLRSSPIFLVREGARYTCTASGLCCGDQHALGPLTRNDVVRLRRHRDDAVIRHPRLAANTIKTDARGFCVFLDDGLCGLHNLPEKPTMCRRFPFGAVGTPAGIRITTAHRCPCRTLGERAQVSEAEAKSVLVDGRGRLVPHARVSDRVPITLRTSMSFARYAEAEAEIVRRVLAGQHLPDVLGLPRRWPAIEGLSWGDIGQTLRRVASLGTGFDHALAWLGQGLLTLLDQAEAAPDRPWREAFDAAEARAPVPRAAEEVLGDYAADAMWDMRWAANGSLDRFASDMAIRLAIAATITQTLVEDGCRPDRAAAEAVMIVEIGGESQPWSQAVARMQPLPLKPPGTIGLRAL